MMNALARCMAFAILAGALPVVADEPKKETAPPVGIDRLDKTWSLKVTSVAIKDEVRQRTDYKDVWLTLEFTKDVDDLKGVRKAFTNSVSRAGLREQGQVALYMFDGENVVIGKMFIEFQQGEITGKAGDAFRIGFPANSTLLGPVKKMELRQTAPEK